MCLVRGGKRNAFLLSFCGISFYITLAFFLVFLTLPTRGQQEANINAKVTPDICMLKVYLVIFVWYLLHREHIFLICIYLLASMSLYIITLENVYLYLYLLKFVYSYIL